jgi:hypothetical protein
LQKYLQFIWLNNWSNLLTTMYLYKNGLSERIICIKCVFLEISGAILHWNCICHRN